MNEDVKYISCDEYLGVERRGTDHVLIDVRTPEEFAEGHIAGALNIPLDRLMHDINGVVPNIHTPIMTYCLFGKRSTTAARELQNMGYQNIRVLEGGYDGYCALKV